MNTVFDVRVVCEQQPQYALAYVEVRYINGVQTTTLRLSPRRAHLFADQLRAAAGHAEERHRSACQAGASWSLAQVRGSDKERAP